MKRNKYDLDIQFFGDGEVLTFDEILEDKTYQSEFDRRVTKALETQREKLLEENEKGNYQNKHEELTKKYNALESEYNAFRTTSANELADIKEKGVISKLIHTSGTTDAELLGLLVEKDISTLERTEDTKIDEVVQGLIEGYKESKASLFAVEINKPTGIEMGGRIPPKEKTALEDLEARLYPKKD